MRYVHELKVSMQRSNHVLSVSDPVHRPLHETEVQRKRVGAPPGASPIQEYYF